MLSDFLSGPSFIEAIQGATVRPELGKLLSGTFPGIWIYTRFPLKGRVEVCPDSLLQRLSWSEYTIGLNTDIFGVYSVYDNIRSKTSES